MSLTYLPYKNISKSKWDDCIRNSVNGLIYAESNYLDHMAANWDAIILNDYEAVMPLTWKKKWGFSYLYQPAFIQQNGIFFKERLPVKIMREFMDLAAARFRFAEFTVNYQNLIDWKQAGLKAALRNNFILQLGKGYDNISRSYDTYIKQRLSRLKKFELQYNVSTDTTSVLKLYRELYGKRMKSVTENDFKNFGKLCRSLLKENRIIIREVHTTGKELLAVILLLRDDKRLYNIISCILPQGKKLLANYYLYDKLIAEFADENILFDFEGSDIPGVAYFYEKFSDSNQQYAFVKFNRLPLPVRLIKK